MLVLEHFGVTDPGKVRANNEDSLLVGEGRDETLFVVADGIGGFEAGEVASSIAVDVLQEVEPSDSLEESIREANRRIVAAAKGDERLQNMGTTVVAMRFGGTEDEPNVEISHVGDSRAYLFRDGELNPVTEDHSLVAELVRSGDLTRAQASEHPQKNLITRALGAEADVEVDTAVLPVEANDRYVLCSDGLTDMVPEAKVLDLLAAHPGSPEEAANALLSAALDAGGVDNITLIVVDLKEDQPAGRRRGDTAEMRVPFVSGEPYGSPQESSVQNVVSRSERARIQRARSKRRRQNLGRIVRALAVGLVVAALLYPFYLWAESRYFLAFDEGEVVVYRGLPYAPLGYQLNEEVERTGLEESSIQERYRERVSEHHLYSEGEADQVVNGLESN